MGNYKISAGTLFEDFETLGDWTQGLGSGSPSGSTASNTTNFKTGTKSLQITSTNGGVYDTKTISLLGTTTGIWGFWFYCADQSPLSSITIYISSSASLTSSFNYSLSGSKIRNGWNFLTIARNDWTNTGGEDWANTMIRLRVRVDTKANVTGIVSFDSLYYGIYARPKVVIMLDDGRTSAYSQAYNYMKNYNMVGTVGVNSANVGTAGWATLANLTEMYNAGWDMCNHTTDHSHLTQLDSATQLTKMTGVTTYLQANGFDLNRGGYHFVFPYGEYDTNALANLTTASLITGRAILTANQSMIYGVDNPTQIYAKELAQTVTLAVAKSYIDNAIATGTTLFLFAHLIVTTPGASTEWPIADFQSLINYIQQYIVGNVLDVVTISDWYNGLTRNRKVA